MLYTFAHIFSLPRGWLCYTLITSQGKKKGSIGVMHITTAEPKNVLSQKPFFVVSLSTLSVVCRHFCSHSADDSFKPVEINRACALLAVRGKKNPPPHPHQFSVLPSPSRLVSAPWTATQRSRFVSKFEVSLEQCPCFGAQRDTLLLCNNTHILIDCVPNNYSVKERHYIKL